MSDVLTYLSTMREPIMRTLLRDDYFKAASTLAELNSSLWLVR